MKLALVLVAAVVVMASACGGSSDALDGPGGAGTAGSAAGGSAGSSATGGTAGSVQPVDGGDSGDDAPPPDAPAAITAEQACQHYVGAYCTQLNSCSPVFLQLFWADVADCEATLTPACLKALAVQETVKTPSFTDACGQSLKTLDCTSLLTRKVPSACMQPSGPRAQGAPCGDDGQCATGYCATPTDQFCGVCAKRAMAGEACKRDDDCEFSLKCADNSHCVAYSLTGGNCDSNHPCAPGLSCKGAVGGKQGTCSTAGGPGASCDPQQIQEPGCDLNQGLFCHIINKVCQKMDLVHAGDGCGVVNNGYALCTDSSVCKTSGTSGTCLAPAKDGSACNNTSGPICETPSKCISGVCAPIDLTSCN